MPDENLGVRKAMATNDMQEVVAELKQIKKLLILQLIKNDTSQKQIAAMLDISEATMSRMMPRANVDQRSSGTKKAIKSPTVE